MNGPAPAPRMGDNGAIRLPEALSIGIGGMVGGGIFAVLGLAVQLAGGGTPFAFLLAGLVALVTAYSYARLSVTFPSQGGTVEFLNQGFGVGLLTGALNVLLWISYVVMLSLYAYAFGSYGASFFPAAAQPLWRQYLDFLWQALRGDLGPSYASPTDTVTALIARHLPVSAELGGWALLVAVGLGALTAQSSIHFSPRSTRNVARGSLRTCSTLRVLAGVRT